MAKSYFGANKLVPVFNFTDKYVYFNDLYNLSQNSYSRIAHQKLELYRSAHDNLYAAAQNFDADDSENSMFQSAINFIGLAAESERTKELIAIEDYKKRLKKTIPRDIQESKKIQETLDKLDSLNLNFDFNNIDDYYKSLTEGINLVRQEGEQYINRLQQIIDHNNNRDIKTLGDLTNDQFLYRLYGDIEGLFKSLTGTQTRIMRDSLATQIRDYTVKFARRKGIFKPNNLLSEEDFMASLAMIMADFENFIQQQYHKENGKDGFTADLIDQAYKLYVEADNERQTKLQKALTENSQELKDIREGFKSQLGIRKLAGEELDKRMKKIDQQKNSPTASRRNKLHRDMEKIILNNETNTSWGEMLSAVSWSARTSQSHGNLAEAVSLLTMQALTGKKIRASAGADLLFVGHIDANIDETALKQYSNNRIQNIKESIENYYAQLTKRQGTRDSQTSQFEEMNQAIREEIKALEQELNMLENVPENIFIYHDSLKFYAGLETGKSKGFHGREMQILNAFDEIYSMANADAFIMPHKDIVTTIAANLSALAVGSGLKGTLENYLSIFAGLLMFDDVQNIALEVKDEFQTERVKEVHLYNINGIYLPSSYILSKIYEVLKEARDYISAGNAARVTISTKDADNAIHSYLATKYGEGLYEYNAEKWLEMSDAATSGTTVQITILVSFIDFLKDLIQ